MSRTHYARLLCSAAVIALASGGAAFADDANFNIQPQSLNTALNAFSEQSAHPVLFKSEMAQEKLSRGISGSADPEIALAQLLQGTGLSFRRAGDTFVIVQGGSADPQSQGAGGGAEVEGLIVTAQKREEDIQDVPIAMSAFSQEDLTRSQIAGGPDLMTQVPNMTFTKTNFSSYSIQIRGIGTQAISATTDPAVAVAFNNTPFIRNRFFEQEFYDLERVEVLRGPQGTLYGRNATAGVVNVISAKPKFVYEAKLSGDVGNYNSTRLEGMINIPLIEDKAALRVAGAWTKRNGYSINQITGSPIDGRDLWSTRLSLRFEPTDWISANLIWEHFEEDDDRLRSGKQLCKKDTPTDVAGIPFPFEQFPGQNLSPIATYNQGCAPASLYGAESFQTPNGFALPYYHPLSQLGLPTVPGLDPYASTGQSRDLRVIESIVDPQYRAQTDTAELQVRFDLSDSLTLDSETAYSLDSLFSTQDYNRFNTAHGAFSQEAYNGGSRAANARPGVLVDGVFCDPQIGCSDRLVALDLSTADSRHFSQEFRLSSDFGGPFNFSLGANFLRYDTLDKYYVFINTMGMQAAKTQWANAPYLAGGPYVAGVSDNSECLPAYMQGDPTVVGDVSGCIYMDPNPIGSLNDLGHNYFLSKNPYRLISYATFGEIYYQVTDSLKITGGLRYTVDKKHAPRIPSWLIVSASIGYPVSEIVDLEWREPTGRLTLDWKPDVSFTDETLLYASFAHGYKAGGANPPPTTVASAGQLDEVIGAVESVLHPKTFEPEFVDAFEIGAKNTLLDGRVTLNANAFYYDYKGYQISQIIDRTAINSNFDADVWGLEIEADWRPIENLRLGFKGGYENTRMADGSEAVDVMDRTAGHADWVVAKPFPSLASNCILPTYVVTYADRINTKGGDPLNPGAGDVGFCVHAYVEGFDPVTQLPYVENPTEAQINQIDIGPLHAAWAGYPGFDPTTAPNNGAGFVTDLSGNELPNAPHYTGTLTADYGLPLRGDWMVNFHADLYYQSEAWTRVFNTPGYDKLKAYTNLNLAARFVNEEAGWTVMAYIKNVMDRDSITGAFLNSDDSGLTTNVFLTEPRLYGLRVTKEFSNTPLLGSLFGERRERPDGEAYSFTIEVGGGPSRIQQDAEILAPDWFSFYRPEAGFPLGPQDTELDLAQAREAKLTYALGPWRLSAAARYGRVGSRAFGEGSQREPDVYFIDAFNQPTIARGRLNWGSDIAVDSEAFTIADFQVGRDIGIGAWGEGGSSLLSLGVRYAQLKSTSDVELRSDADFRYPAGENAFKYERDWHHFESSVESERSFQGIGPTISWDASSRLLGNQDTGHIDLDWGLDGGMLFGKQKADVRQEALTEYINGSNLAPVTTTVIADIPPRQESKSVQVPVAGVNLGLSYSLDRLKLSGGYRWERYFDAIDGGIDEAEQYDRTIDGPYLKLSVGFGG
jgi:iron complex outermembrane receptor protein